MNAPMLLSPAALAKIDQAIAKYPADQKQSAVMAALTIAQDELRVGRAHHRVPVVEFDAKSFCDADSPDAAQESYCDPVFLPGEHRNRQVRSYSEGVDQAREGDRPVYSAHRLISSQRQPLPR